MRVHWTLPLLATLAGFKGVNAGLIDDIVDAIVHAVDCDSCHALFVPLKGVAILGDSAFSATFVAVCKALGVSCPLYLESCINIEENYRPRMTMSAKASSDNRLLSLHTTYVPSLSLTILPPRYVRPCSVCARLLR